MSAAPKCANCGDSGCNPGSDYLDCTHCDASTQHAELGKFLVSNYADPDCAWKVHQRTYAMGVAAVVKHLEYLSNPAMAEHMKAARDGFMMGDRTAEFNNATHMMAYARSALAAIATPKVKT